MSNMRVPRPYDWSFDSLDLVLGQGIVSGYAYGWTVRASNSALMASVPGYDIDGPEISLYR